MRNEGKGSMLMIGLPVLAGLDGKPQQGKVLGARVPGSSQGRRQREVRLAGALEQWKQGPLKPLSPLDRKSISDGDCPGLEPEIRYGLCSPPGQWAVGTAGGHCTALATWIRAWLAGHLGSWNEWKVVSRPPGHVDNCTLRPGLTMSACPA